MRSKVNGTTLNVFQQPASRKSHSAIVAPALVFLHYFGGSSRAWSKVIGELSNEYYCIAPDMRGFGDSDAAPTKYAVSDSVDDVAALIDALRLEHYILVGHSMGGKIALSFAARRPLGLKSLILLAPSPPSPEPIPDDERARLLATYGERRAAAETIAKITAQALPSELLEQALKDNLRTSRAAWTAWLERGSREDLTAQASQVHVPVLVVAGAKDKAMTAALLQREVVRRIAGARLKSIPDAGHLLPLEAPQATANLIREHIQ
jgi:pimeloyl-ACP methyl ester carboxylesterase